MSKPKLGKGSNPKAVAMSDNKPSKPILPSIFTQGNDGKTVEIRIANDEAFKALKESLGTENPHLWNLFLGQLEDCGHKHRSAAENLNQILPILHSIKPRDALEGMLAVQMAGVHNMAIQCLSRAKDASFIDHIGCLLNQSAKLMRVFTAQMEALQGYRGKSTQQKVTVEHVHVHQGGQAIVGAVNPTGKGVGGGDDGQD